MAEKYQRLVYGPEVQAFVYTSNNKYIDLSPHIISGTLNRRVNEVSSVSLTLQHRFDSTGKSLIIGKITPMDRIVVYLKKTKPLLVFSGYVDLVPFAQPFPAPVTIEASCTLKRLEFTYWDPGLPKVIDALAKYGFVFSNLSGGVSGFQPPNTTTPQDQTPQAEDANLADASGTGFAQLLYFLLHDVGGWDKEDLYILPLPEQWIIRVAGIYSEVMSANAEMQENLTQFFSAFFGTSGDSNGDGVNEVTGNSSGNYFAGNILQVMATYLKKNDSPYYQSWPAIADKAGKQYDVDPRVLIAITGAEHSFGSQGGFSGNNNPFGLGPGIDYSSFQAAFDAAARTIKSYRPTLNTINEVQTKWAPQGAANDPANLNSNWRKNVKKFFGDMGGVNPESNNLRYPSNDIPLAGETSDRLGAQGNTGVVTVPGFSIPANSTKKATIRLSAGHTAPRQRGYEGQDNPSEQPLNFTAMTRLASKLREDKYAKHFDVVIETGSAPKRSFNGEIYIQLHHDSSTYPGKKGGIGVPSQNSKDANGKALPNQYSGEAKIETPVRRVDNDANLITNSFRAAQYIVQETARRGWDIDLVSNGNIRMHNNYTFYYTQADTSLLFEFPFEGARTNEQFLTAVAEGLLKFKLEGIREAANNAPAEGGVAPSDNASQIPGVGPILGENAQKLLQVMKDYIESEKGKKMKYQLGGERGMPLDEADPEVGMDCSGFVGNAMITAGLADRGFSPTTVSFYTEGEKLGHADPARLKPGTFLIKGGANGYNSAGHMMVYAGNNTVYECTSWDNTIPHTAEGSGPRARSYSQEDTRYEGVIFNAVGVTDNGTGGASDTENASRKGKIAAFNVFFTFPGNLLESVLLTGYRALENDVKLIDSVKEVTHSSMRVFSSLPNGKFIAWFPDYFNISEHNPWMRIKLSEVLDCTIDLSDKNLTTHVYVTGNPWGAPGIETEGTILLEKLLGAGVATIEQPYLLDSFLRKKSPKPSKKNGRLRSILEGQGAVVDFLNKYGARPYNEKMMTLRHPLMEFFHAYHTFMKKWAEQFISRVELTFMPELFPGMIIEIEDLELTFYVEEVQHSFSYESGFTTTVTLSAPGTTNADRNPGMVLVNPGFDTGATIRRKTPEKPRVKPPKRGQRPAGRESRTVSVRGRPRDSVPRNSPRTGPLNNGSPIPPQDDTVHDG